MATLGSFGVERPPVEDSFAWFGVDIRVHPDLSDLVIIELFGAMQDKPNDDEDHGPAMLEAMSSIVATLVHPDDVDAFMRTSRSHRQQLEDIVRLAMELLGALAGRPTQLPSDSSDGQLTTAPSSTGDSSSRALEVLDGRPDLQVAVLRRQTA